MRRVVALGALALLLPAVALAAFNTDLQQGDRGGLVVELQDYLISQVHLAAGNNTGYFGPLTKTAVQSFQTKHGIQPVSGFFGPLTRAKANALTGGVLLPTTNPNISAQIAALLQQIQLLEAQITAMTNSQTTNTLSFSALPSMGTLPLTVTFTGSASGTYTLDYGDGTQPVGSVCANSAACGIYTISQNHTYTSVGRYVAKISDSRSTRTATIIVQSAPVIAPSISVSVPSFTDYIDRGSDLNISWQSSNAPAGSQVYLSLVRSDGSTVGAGSVVATARAISGTYSWRIPYIWMTNALSAQPFTLKPTDITGGQSYKIRAVMYAPTTGTCVSPSSSNCVDHTIQSSESASFTIGAPGSATDEQRWKDLQTIENALERYKTANGSYPGHVTTYYWIDDNNYSELLPCSSMTGGLKPYLANTCTFLDPRGHRYAYARTSTGYKLGAQFETSSFRKAGFTWGSNNTNLAGYYEPIGTSVLPAVPDAYSAGNALFASPSSGAKPLAVTFLGTVTSGGYTVDFGDGASTSSGCSHGACTTSNAVVNVGHTYTVAGTYTAKLRRHHLTNEGQCAGVDCNVVATSTVSVN